MSTILEALSWRYATKKFDPTKKISPDQLNLLLESARLAPSSYGLQPWKFVVVQSPDLRQKIRTVAWDQSQVTDASHLIVLCVKTDIDEAYVDRYMQSIAAARSITTDHLSAFKNMILGSLRGRAAHDITEWNKRQTYIALGMLLTTAALQRIDAAPMEGFDPSSVDDILDLARDGFTSTVLCAVGFRSADDPSALQAKARFSLEEIVSYR